MIHRYQGDEGRRVLIEALRGQRFVEGDLNAATALAEVVELSAPQIGDVLMSQGADDNDLVVIISGSASVWVNKRKVADRRAGQHVGEMALMDSAEWRSATIVANEPMVIGRIAEPAFTRVANQYPRMWRMLGVEIGARLRERGKFLTAPNELPHVFIGSSSEALPVARAIHACFAGDPFVVSVWDRGVFEASKTNIETLEKTARSADFGILVFSADDKVFSRREENAAPRDNVVFELGLFMGALGRERTFFVQPRGTELKVPSDILGVTPVKYVPPGDPSDLASALGAGCAEIRDLILAKGPK